jgi:hypothetical protein
LRLQGSRMDGNEVEAAWTHKIVDALEQTMPWTCYLRPRWCNSLSPATRSSTSVEWRIRYLGSPDRAGSRAVTMYVPDGTSSPRGGRYPTGCPILNLCLFISLPQREAVPVTDFGWVGVLATGTKALENGDTRATRVSHWSVTTASLSFDRVSMFDLEHVEKTVGAKSSHLLTRGAGRPV